MVDGDLGVVDGDLRGAKKTVKLPFPFPLEVCAKNTEGMTMAKSFWRTSIPAAFCLALLLSPVEAEARRGGRNRETDSSRELRALIAQAESALREMRGAQNRIARKAEEARASRDVLRFNCVDEKQKLVTALLGMSEGVIRELKGNQAGPLELAEQEVARVEMAQEKVGTYAAEADLCLGSVAFREKGEGTTDRDFHDSTPNPNHHDPMEPEPVEDKVFRPPPASPVKPAEPEFDF